MPAFATRTSTGPCSASTLAKASSTAAASRTSQAATVRPSTFSPEREVMVTWSPPAASRRAMASPMPRFPPVTRTDRLIGVPSFMISKSNRRAPASVPGWGRQAWDRLPLVEHSTHKDQTTGPVPSGGATNGHRIDPEFAGLPLRELSAAALERARELGAEHADFRAERIRGQEIGLSDGHLETLMDADELGLAVRVVLDGTWG